MKKTLWIILVFLALSGISTRVTLAQNPTPTPDIEHLRGEVQSLSESVELLTIKVESELEASKVRMEAMKETNDRNFFLFAILGAIGSLLGGVIVFSSWTTEKQERKQNQQMFNLQEKNLKEVNTITTAIAAGANENVESLNTMLSTFQQIMKFKVDEAGDVRELYQDMKTQLDELKAAQRQQVDDLLQTAVRLRRGRHLYTRPDPDLQRQIVEFRTQMDLMQQVVLNRYTGVESPGDENRRYGEIYLRRGVIAYYDNDIVKSREMLRVAERFFPIPKHGSENMTRVIRLPTAFTQYYLALIEKNYGSMRVAQDFIEKSYAIHGQQQQNEFLTPTTRAEILSYHGDMDNAQIAIQEVLDRAEKLKQGGILPRQDAIYALRARLYLGNTYYVTREYNQALQHYQDALMADVRQDYSYYTYHSIAQVHNQLGNVKEAKENKRLAYEELLRTGHLQTKVALDTLILLNALAYLCTRENEPDAAEAYRETAQEHWFKIREVNGLELRLFSFDQKRPIDKNEFFKEVFGNTTS